MVNLKITDLGKYFGYRWVFRDVNLERSGGVIGVAGTNGSGKSTLLRCMSNLVRQDTGTIEWVSEGGEPVKEFDVRMNSGYAAPYIHMYNDLTCRENLQFLLPPLDIAEPDLDILFDEAGISGKIDAPFRSLSSGQQQRVKLIGAIMHHPGVLFLDEPGTNLDHQGFDYVQRIVESRRSGQMLTIIASNNSTELDLCNTIIRLETRN